MRQQLTDNFPGQGALSNRRVRFETYQRIKDSDQPVEQKARRQITTYIELVRGIITRNQSPDIPFEQSINPYRGCEHGCVYCYARPGHAYLGLSPGLDFERQIFIKKNASEVLLKELKHKRYRPRTIVLGANTDPYQPIERLVKKTRSILEILLNFRHPVIIITKGNLILRDLDLINELNRLGLIHINISLTSLDTKLVQKLEPRAASPAQRLHVIKELARSGLKPGVLLAPIIPGLTDHELANLLKAAHKAGASYASYILLRLPHEVRDLFLEWLNFHYPEKSKRVQHLIRQTRAGQLYNSEFSQRMTGSGQFARLIADRFRILCKQLKLNAYVDNLRLDLFQHGQAAQQQMQLFENLSTDELNAS